MFLCLVDVVNLISWKSKTRHCCWMPNFPTHHTFQPMIPYADHHQSYHPIDVLSHLVTSTVKNLLPIAPPTPPPCPSHPHPPPMASYSSVEKSHETVFILIKLFSKERESIFFQRIHTPILKVQLIQISSSSNPESGYDL